MAFWSKWFGREADIDFSAPREATVNPPIRRHFNNSNADLKVTRMDTGEAVILSRGCTLDLANNVDVTMEGMKPTTRKPRARKTPSAHGKRSGKPKSRSQKKPARKRSRK